MDDKKIRAFLTIIQLGSLRRAAQELNYTQSGLTQMMKHLEQEVGCRLLRRSHSGVTMTESAEHLLPYFQAADQALLQLRHESEQFSGPQRKTIVIGAFPSIAKRWLPQRIQRFRLLHPEIQLDLRLGGDEVADWAAQRSVDLALADEVLRGQLRVDSPAQRPAAGRLSARRRAAPGRAHRCGAAGALPVYHAGFARPARAHPAVGSLAAAPDRLHLVG